MISNSLTIPVASNLVSNDITTAANITDFNGSNIEEEDWNVKTLMITGI
jgi:hypothetical protein